MTCTYHVITQFTFFVPSKCDERLLALKSDDAAHRAAARVSVRGTLAAEMSPRVGPRTTTGSPVRLAGLQVLALRTASESYLSPVHRRKERPRLSGEVESTRIACY
jgi:hypothetical protein